MLTSRTDELIGMLREIDDQRMSIMQELSALRKDHHARILGTLTVFKNL